MPTPITATTIAKITGVTVTAVGQWRRRDKTFPQPLKPPTRPVTFDQEEVFAWLKATGRTVKNTESESKPALAMETVLDRLRTAVGSSQYTQALTLFAAQRHLDDTTGMQSVAIEPLAGELKRMLSDSKIQNAYAQTAGLSATDILRYLDAYDSTSRMDASNGSPQVVNDLLAALAPDTCTSIIDITCGAGGTLDTLHRRFPGADLAGNDINESVLAMAQARALVSGWNATWFQEDALAPHVFPTDTFDLVCAVPPWGMRFNKDLLDAEPQRWPYSVPYRTDDTIWLQLAHHLLRKGGTAIITLPISALVKSSSRAVLGRMASDRSLQAVIELPSQLHFGTSIATIAVVLTKSPATPTESVLFTRITDDHVTRRNRHQVTAIDATEIIAAVKAHQAGEHLTPSPLLAQVERLVLAPTDKTYAPTYWIDQANTASPGDLRQDLDSAVTKITPINGIGDLLDPLVLTPDHLETMTVRDLPSVKSVGVGRGADKDKELQCGDICVSHRRATVCTVDGVRPDKGYLQVLRCDPKHTDPWFLAAVLTAALDTGSATEGAGIQRLSLRLVDVPMIDIQQQRALGAIYRDMVDRQRHAEEQAAAWGQLSSQVAATIASGLAKADPHYTTTTD